MTAPLELVFTATGGVELENVSRDEVVWASDVDDEFRDAFNDEFMNADRDAARVIEWLIDAGIISEEQGEELEVTSEADAEMDDDEDSETPHGETFESD